jgi:energy-coupling factor transporter transmembrane protein EcfT
VLSHEGLYLGAFKVGKFTSNYDHIAIGTYYSCRAFAQTAANNRNFFSQYSFNGSMALRFISNLQQEMNNIREAQLARGANFQSGRLSGKMRSIISIAAPLTISILRRSDELVEAMEARGYQPGKRTCLRELAFSY